MTTILKFRVDAGNLFGLGHLIRCLSIAGIARRNKIESVFYLNQPSPEVISIIHQYDFKAERLENDISFLKHVDKTDTAILDGYHFSSEYEKLIRKEVKKLITIDDLHNRHFYSDVIINHTPGVSPSDYEKESYTHVYAGLNYCLLRSDIVNAKRRKNAPGKLNKCFLCMGGEDPTNFTLKTINYLLDETPNISIDVVVGLSYRNLDELKNFSKTRPQINIHINLAAAALAGLIDKADFAVVSASTISLECVYLRIPLYLLKTADNQNKNYDYLTQHHIAMPITEVKKYSFEQGQQILLEQLNCFSEDIELNIKNILFP